MTICHFNRNEEQSVNFLVGEPDTQDCQNSCGSVAHKDCTEDPKWCCSYCLVSN